MRSTAGSVDKKSALAGAFKMIALAGVIAAFVAFVLYIGVTMGELLGATLAAVAVAYLLLPLVKRMEERLVPWLAALIAVLLSYGVVISGLVLLMPELIRQLGSIGKSVSSLAGHLKAFIAELQIKLNGMGLPVDINSLINNGIAGITGSISDIVKRIIELGVNFIGSLPVITLVPILTFYFLKDRAYFISRIEFIVPVKWRTPICKMYRSADKTIKSYIKAQLLVAFIVGALTSLAYAVIGVPYPLLMGLFMGIGEIIPYFGPVLGAVPACIGVLIASPDKLIWTVAAVVAVQQIEGNFLSPYLMGAHFDINPVTVVAVLWISGRIFGFAGFIFAIPIYVILKDVTVILFNKVVKAG